jgi:hypothetical protein
VTERQMRLSTVRVIDRVGESPDARAHDSDYRSNCEGSASDRERTISLEP